MHINYGKKVYLKQNVLIVGKAKWTDHWVSFVDSVMHLALMALPIRALFIPIGFQSIVCDPNVMFAAIEKAKKVEDKEKIIEETKDFFYFNESTRKKYDEKTENNELRKEKWSQIWKKKKRKNPENCLLRILKRLLRWEKSRWPLSFWVFLT